MDGRLRQPDGRRRGRYRRRLAAATAAHGDRGPRNGARVGNGNGNGGGGGNRADVVRDRRREIVTALRSDRGPA